MLADVAHELDGLERPKPLCVVHENGTPAAACALVELEEMRQLRANAADVFVYLLDREQRPLCLSAARITDHSGTTANERDRPVTGALEVHERHDRDEAANVEARRGRIEADIARHDASLKERRGAFRVLIEQPAPL